MAEQKSIPVHFATPDGSPRPQEVINALRGVCRSLDAADITSAKGEEAERISELISAAAILSTQLVDRMDAVLQHRMEAVNG